MEAPDHAAAWMKVVRELSQASARDGKTAGHGVTACLPAALEAFDAEG